ncbi:hypothetical protein BGP_6197 [Beggiatoa sp. PS]|nr:hypothetical protein BGP_6197 [Beggiatoa sp. PS]
MGDIEKALIMGNTTLDELIDDIQDVATEISQLPFERALTCVTSDDSDKITPLPINRKLAGATIDFDIKYTTEWGDPYTPHRH